METLASRIAHDGITAEVTYTGQGVTDDKWEHRAYEVTLTREGQTLTTPFKMGMALAEPTAEVVLSSLIMDAATIENEGGTFENWASELGFDPDSRKAERVYNEAVAQTEALRAFLGDEYDDYLWETESL